MQGEGGNEGVEDCGDMEWNAIIRASMISISVEHST